MSSRVYWIMCLIAGLAVAAITVLLGQTPGLAACGPAEFPVVLAFEFARGPEDIARIMGAPPCSDAPAAAMVTHTWLDILGYIPAFTAYEVLAALALRGNGPKLAGAAVAAALIAAVCDQSEDQLLLAIVADPPGIGVNFALLSAFVLTKFALLSVVVGLLGALVWRAKGLWRIAGGLMIAGCVIGVSGVASRELYGLFSLGIGIGWVVLLVVATAGAMGRFTPVPSQTQ